MRASGFLASGRRAGAGLLLVLAPLLRAEDPFLSFDFEDEDLSAFFNPTGPMAVDLCGDLLPSGDVIADEGQVIMTNDTAFGISIFGFFPAFVEDAFPEDTRDFRVRVRVNLESVNQLVVYLRARIFLDETTEMIDSSGERGYAFSVVPQGVDPEFPGGMIALTEFTACHEDVPHPEWPHPLDGSARADPNVPIFPGEWYWLEATAQGDDDGGPVRLTAKLWEDGADPPETPHLVVTDSDGLPHSAETLAPEADAAIFFGTSFDLGQQPGASARVDDLSIALVSGCEEPPAVATRRLWKERVVAEGLSTALYDPGDSHRVEIELSGVRSAGACEAAGEVVVVESYPPAWEASGVSNGGEADSAAGTVTWRLDLSQGAPPILSYNVETADSGVVGFSGLIGEPGSDFAFLVGGDTAAATTASVAPISDFMSIQHWLTLGPFTREVGGANPGEAEIQRDYLTDGEVGEVDVMPRAGDTIEPDFGGAAASLGLAPDTRGRNPGGVPTWLEWRDFDDLDDRIDYESIYGDLSDIMAYAVTYLEVEEEQTVHFGISSDDSIHVLLDGETLHAHNVPRGALDRAYQDTPANFPNLGNVNLAEGLHTLMVKVFEGGGEHNFRVGFVDEFGSPLFEAPEGLSITLSPVVVPPLMAFRRGDVDDSGDLVLTDAIRLLGFLFLGDVAPPPCAEAADADDNGVLQVTDAILILSFLFLGTEELAPPGADCGPDPVGSPDLGCETFTNC